MSKLRAALSKKIALIKGLEERPSKVAGGSALFFKGKEIAHFHHDTEIDVRLTKKVIKARDCHTQATPVFTINDRQIPSGSNCGFQAKSKYRK